MSKSISIGLIGGGYWGKNLIREFNSLGALSYICDINTAALENYKKSYPAVSLTTNWDDVLNDKTVTAVCIALPAEMHYTFARKSLLADKDVFVEKPITLNVEQAEELVKIAEKRSKILMVGHLLHYHPCIEKIKNMIDNGMIGRVRNITANRLSLGIFRKEENVLWSFAPHDISVVLSLCKDMPKSVVCLGKDHINEGVHDVTNSILNFKNAYVNINVNWLNPYKEQKMSIIGDKGMILFDDVSKENKITYFPEYIQYSSDMNSTPTPIKNNGVNVEVDTTESPLLRECRHFVECCNTRQLPITSGDEGVQVLKVLDSLQESLKSKKEVSLENEAFFAHETAVIDKGAEIGEGTKVWHFSHICKGAKIGKNCNIGQNVFIAGGAVLGDNCKVQNNVSIYAGVEAEDHVFFGPSCVLTNDINPRCMHSKNGEYIRTILKQGVTLGANCTIVCGNTIGKHALIGAGCVVTKDVEPHSIMVGNPGTKSGEIDERGLRSI